MILLAVVAASPGTIRLWRRKKAKVDKNHGIRYRSPAILAVLLIEFISSLGFIVFSPF